MENKVENRRNWWHDAVFYQIYPRSFFDSSNDGNGDLKGITEKLDYIKELGVDAIWICPCFVSPKADNGYDVADYRNIDPDFGTLEDWKEMCEGVHQRGMRLFMDLVVNHTSDEHPWFVSASADRNSPYYDYYIFREGKKDGSEPSNWLSVFGGPAWKYNEATHSYYLHLFAEKQPDLNWRNPKVMDEVSDIIAYWADLGVDGFRLDAFNNIDKDQSFPDVETQPGEKYGFASKYYVSRPAVDEYIHELYKRELGPRNLITVSETAYCPEQKALDYCDPAREEFDMLYMFDLLNFDQEGYDKFAPKSFRVSDLKKVLRYWIDILHGTSYMALFLGNHDQCRPVSRFGNTGLYRKESAKTLASALYFLEGIPYIYQGEELGLINNDFSSIEEFRDVEVFNYWKQHVTEKKEDPEKVLRLLNERSRDTSRAPIPWSDEVNGGFSRGEPWMKVGSEYKMYNVQAEEADPDSVLHFYRKLFRVYHEKINVIKGETEWIDFDSDLHFSYIRKNDDEILVCLNSFSDTEISIKLREDLPLREAKILLSNYDRKKLSKDPLTLKPWECLVLGLEKTGETDMGYN